ncbi:nuclear receptor subfamily 0 group B member 1-like [Takifugu rubripes]|uniref:Nuclear receptor subfamily 0, group B, member 1 n=1 Tax=Takifugu rubripes TaxID=31033 RepID=H2U320_TAKRU|nr:nuclear receptor subfamily 0 group B member 1-like [Takifugu rubripes]
MPCCKRREGGDAARGSILYSILKRGAPRRGRQLEAAAARRPWCTCASACKLVTIRAPVLMFTAASQVLAKTFRFLKNVACFRGLPAGDQRLLVRHRWAPLLVVGLVQDSVHFDTVETRRPSLLHTILTRHKKDTSAGAGDPGVPVGVAEGIQAFLVRCRGLGMSANEFALVKGALLFSAELKKLECGDYIQTLHREAQRALYDHVRDKTSRMCRLQALLQALRSVDPEAVSRLFFRPVTGSIDVDEHVLALFDQQ